MATKNSKANKGKGDKFKWEAGDVKLYSSIEALKKANPNGKFISAEESYKKLKKKKK